MWKMRKKQKIADSLKNLKPKLKYYLLFDFILFIYFCGWGINILSLPKLCLGIT